MSAVIQFPMERRAAMPPRATQGRGEVLILPVVRIERHGDVSHHPRLPSGTRPPHLPLGTSFGGR